MKKRKVKGMTLVEIIIATFVFGVTAMIMVGIITTANKLVMNANHVNNKTAVEAPVSAVRDKTTLQNQKAVAADGSLVDIPLETQVGEVEVKAGGQTQKFRATRYSTGAMADTAKSNTNTSFDGDLNFYELETIPTTP